MVWFIEKNAESKGSLCFGRDDHGELGFDFDFEFGVGLIVFQDEIFRFVIEH